MNRKNTANWEILEETLYEEFHLFTLKRSTRVNPRTGKPFTFFLMNGLDWVNVIPITKNNNVVLVRQYRHGSERYEIETPGGSVEPGEDPQIAARRELNEETGFSASNLEFLGTLYPNPAMQGMRIHYYLARDVEKTSVQSLDPGEDISVSEVPFTEFENKIRSGEISSALIVSGYGLLAQRLVSKTPQASSS